MPRVLVVIPSWIGDAVMATVALRLLRAAWPGAYIGALVRPGIDELLAGLPTVDEFHLHRSTGLMGPKHAAWHIRPRRYESALLLTNSFSTALITRLAAIPRRVGYNRDLRGVLLTDRLEAPVLATGKWAPVPAVIYYAAAAKALIDPNAPRKLTWEWRTSIDDAQRQTEAALDAHAPDPTQPLRLELNVSPKDLEAAQAILRRGGVEPKQPIAILNPGGNNPAKRWPIDRFAALADELATRHGLKVLINAGPSEADLAAQLARAAKRPALALPALNPSLGAVKALIGRARLLVTNDTGPRHIAAALGTPVLTLFGPTDHRWTTIPTREPTRQRHLIANPSAPLDHIADEHPAEHAIERIPLADAIAACESLLSAMPTPSSVP